MLCAAGLSSSADGSQDLMHASPRTLALPLSHTPALKLQLLVNGDTEAWREQSFQVRRMNKLAGPFCDFQGQEGDQKSLDHHSHTSKGWQGCSPENPAQRLHERQLNSCVTIDKSHPHWAPVLI